MVDQIVTKQQLIDAHVDAQALEDIVNDGPEIQVQTRLGRLVWTLATLEQRSLLKISEWQNAINTIIINDGVPALAVINESGEIQQEINDFGGANWWNKPGGYKLGATVKLANGDKVKSTVPNNITNPNIDMTGWVNENDASASQILDKSGLNQQQVNDGLNSIAELIAIASPQTGDRQFVKGLQGGTFVYNAARSGINDGVVTFDGWVRASFMFITPLMAGATLGADDSAALQKAFDYAQANSMICDGLNLTYKVHQVVFDSGLYFSNAKLELNVFDQNLVNVLTTKEVAEVGMTPLKDVVFTNIHIDGKRSLLTGLPDYAFSEDGGRSGFRFSRPMHNVKLINSSADYCGTEGIIIFPKNIADPWQIWVKDIEIMSCRFNWNSRHGGSADSLDGITIMSSDFSHNGLDLVEGAPLTTGNAGRRYAGNLYGVGFDFEEYVGVAYSKNIKLLNNTMLGNAANGLNFSRTGATTVAASSIQVIGGSYDKGIATGVPADDYSIIFAGYSLSGPKYYDGVVVSGVNLNGSGVYAIKSTISLNNLQNEGTHSFVSSEVYLDKPVVLNNTDSTIFTQQNTYNSTGGATLQIPVSTLSKILFYDNAAGVARGLIEVLAEGGSSSMYFGTHGQRRWTIQPDGSFLPTVNGTLNLGWEGNRIKAIYLTNAPNVSSDRRYKEDIRDISEIEKGVAADLRKSIKAYRLIESNDKIHVGMIAQEVVEIFAKHGLDAHEYKMIHKSDDGMYSVVYEQLIMFILSS